LLIKPLALKSTEETYDFLPVKAYLNLDSKFKKKKRRVLWIPWKIMRRFSTRKVTRIGG
jgi:hypothetical protein